MPQIVWTYGSANYLLVSKEPTSLRGPVTRVYRLVPREPKKEFLGSYSKTLEETRLLLFGNQHNA